MNLQTILITLVCMVLSFNVAGCRDKQKYVLLSNCCERLQVLKIIGETEGFRVVAFFGEDTNEPVEISSYDDFVATIFSITGCCYAKPHSVASDWMYCNRLECIRPHLESSNTQKIVFYVNILMAEEENPEEWTEPWAEIVEPTQIAEVLRLLDKAMDNEENKFANEDAVASDLSYIQIITDKGKFIIRFSASGINKGRPIRGVGWTAHGLKEKLEEWGRITGEK